MPSFLALYQGAGLHDADLVAVSTDPGLISEVAGALLKQHPVELPTDPVRAAIVRGKKKALRLVRNETKSLRRAPEDE